MSRPRASQSLYGGTPTVESVQGARIVVYGFVAGDVGADDSISRLDIRVDDSAVQYFERRPEHGTSLFIAAAFVLQNRQHYSAVPYDIPVDRRNGKIVSYEYEIIIVMTTMMVKYRREYGLLTGAADTTVHYSDLIIFKPRPKCSYPMERCRL